MTLWEDFDEKWEELNRAAALAGATNVRMGLVAVYSGREVGLGVGCHECGWRILVLPKDRDAAWPPDRSDAGVEAMFELMHAHWKTCLERKENDVEPERRGKVGKRIIDRAEVVEGENGQFRVRAKAANGEVIMTSEQYVDRAWAWQVADDLDVPITFVPHTEGD